LAESIGIEPMTPSLVDSV